MGNYVPESTLYNQWIACDLSTQASLSPSLRAHSVQWAYSPLHPVHRGAYGAGPTASMLAAQGASLLEIADVLGHKTLAMVKRYSHLVVDHKAKVIEKMIVAKGL
jgi:integrase